MSELALVPVQEIRASLTLSQDLSRWVCAAEDGAELPANLPPSIIEEARRHLILIDRLMNPVPDKVIRPWLAVMAGHYTVQRPKSESESAAWARTIELAMEGMPVGVFTKANLGEILLRSAFLPTAAQLMEVLAPDRDVLERRAHALRRVAGQT